MHAFDTPDPTTLVVRTGSGQVTVTTAETARTTVELRALNAAAEEVLAEATVEQRGSTVLVDVPRQRWGLFREGPAVAVTVTCPTGSTMDLTSESADIDVTGTVADASVSSGSGSITLETITGGARLKSGSGSVSARHVAEGLAVKTGSGDVDVARSEGSATVTVGSGHVRFGDLTGDVVTKTGSGDVDVDRLGGTLMTKTGSGNLTVRRATSGAVRANGASGDITIGIEEGTAAWLDVSTLSGRVHQELGESDGPGEHQQRIEITAHTVSGDLRVHRS